MKKNLPQFLSILIILFLSFRSYSQILCIYCYEQNDSISQNVNNLVLNGSFENTNCQPNVFSNSFCPNSGYYGCDVVNWTCTGGGSASYASIDDYTFTQTADGNMAAYFGNGSNASACSAVFNDTSCLDTTGCELLNIPVGYPTNDVTYGGNIGVSLEQTVSGLTIGATYVLEFWAGGEPQSHGWMDAGVFSVDIGFGKTYLRDKPTCPGCIGTTYIIEFNATSTSHTIKFTNWGHICIPCTELILDNVRLYTLPELSPSVPSCSTVPIAIFNAPHNICPGTCTDFTNLSINAFTYSWSFPGANPSTSTDINPSSICYSTPGNYDVTLIATGSGGVDTLTLPNYITVYPYPAPQGIIQSGDTLFANQGSISYQWYYNGVIIVGASNYFYVTTQDGDYNVVCTDANGCEVEAAIFDVTGIQLAGNNNKLAIYPNPVGDELSIKYPEIPAGTSINISVYNILGEKVYSDIDHNQPTVNCRQLSSGMYRLEIISAGKIYRAKFIKSSIR
ncbi:MAG: T9SS type A sorting domain-containing protein [Bacteroidetes bacterium]|nr:T9SS type A sorting domain-containing protein [Bacteroidota bacterium]